MVPGAGIEPRQGRASSGIQADASTLRQKKGGGVMDNKEYWRDHKEYKQRQAAKRHWCAFCGRAKVFPEQTCPLCGETDRRLRERKEGG